MKNIFVLFMLSDRIRKTLLVPLIILGAFPKLALTATHSLKVNQGKTYYLHTLQYHSQIQNSNLVDDGGKIIADKTKAVNYNALTAFDEFGRHLGVAVITILFTLEPSVIVIGGRLAKYHLFFDDAIWEQIQSFSHSQIINDLSLKFVSNGSSPISGTASLYYDRNAKE